MDQSRFTMRHLRNKLCRSHRASGKIVIRLSPNLGLVSTVLKNATKQTIMYVCINWMPIDMTDTLRDMQRSIVSPPPGLIRMNRSDTKL
ncbi:hypothetical protein PIB30_074960 [Stylosanthes scabra]|uniref:Uncharacterized protein n=1 Tax=Stylosanthes scabra TaxID=79078 RepID=A0ABU6RQ56_9FABA|nr:hypothetical protein [Stylosanthes scabra]